MTVPGSTPLKGLISTPYDVRGLGVTKVPLEASSNFELVISGCYVAYNEGGPVVHHFHPVSQIASNAVDIFYKRLNPGVNYSVFLGRLCVVVFPGAPPNLADTITDFPVGGGIAFSPIQSKSLTTSLNREDDKTPIPSGQIVPSVFKDLFVPEIIVPTGLSIGEKTALINNWRPDPGVLNPGLPPGFVANSFIIGIDLWPNTSAIKVQPLASGTLSPSFGPTGSAVLAGALVFMRAT